MKQKIYILGLVTTLLIFLGSMLKVNHLPGASILLTIGMLTLVLIFLPLALINNYRSEGTEQTRTLYLVTWLTCFVVFTSMLFKIMHWPFAGYGLLIALPFPYLVFLPVFLSVTAKIKYNNVRNTVFVFFLMAIISAFSVLLALNVSKDRIDDSYNLSRNYIGLETALKEIPGKQVPTAVNTKIDDVLKIVDEYQALILKREGLSCDQWNKTPGNLLRPDAKQAAFEALNNGSEPFPGDRLELSLKNLMDELKRNEAYSEFASSAAIIFDYREDFRNDHPRKFENNDLSWLLIYLDGLKANLNILKTVVPRSTSL